MQSKNIFYDFKAGIVVFLVALPLCLGIALACKVTLFSGVIAGVVGGLLVTVFSGSKFSVSGPAAGLTAIVLASISQLGSFPAFLAAAVFAGVMQLLLGILKAGSIANYIPNSVIKGMLAGIGIILILKQIPHLFGYDKDPEGDEQFIQLDGENSFTELVHMINFLTPGAIVIGVLSILILILTERPFYKKNKFLSNLPGPLIVVLIGILLTLAFNRYSFWAIDVQHLVKLPTITNFSDLQANLTFPDFSLANTSKFWIVALTIAVVASLETLLSIEAVDKLDPKKNESNTNKELLAQGIGNITCGFLGGLPVTSVIVRSSANINAGAQSKLAIIIHAVLLFACVLLIPNVLGLIPNACLAAILIMTGYKLAKISLFTEHYKKGMGQLVPFVITILVMLFTDLLKGVAAGLMVAVIFIIRDNIKSSFDIGKDIINDRMHHIIRLPQHITFFNKGFLINYFSKLEANCTVIIDGSLNKSIDNDAKDVLQDFLKTAEDRSIITELVKLKL